MKKILLLLSALPIVAFSQQQAANNSNLLLPDFSTFFQQAYQLYPGIPGGILEAVAYGNTRIQNIVHTPGEVESCMGLPKVYGVMGLTLDGKNYFSNNLVYVSNLSGISISEIINSPEKNILSYAKAFNSVMNTIASQHSANGKNNDLVFRTLTALSELPHQNEGQIFALNTQLYSYYTFLGNPQFQAEYNFPDHNFDVQTLFGEENYKVLSSSHVTVSGETIIDKQGNTYKSLGGNNNPSVQSADYSGAIWTAAASCNYSSRTAAVTAVVIHDVEGSYSSCISWFQNCSANVSAHYVVRSSDGQITQMVLESKKAWHVGSENGYTIGIEHEGFQAQTGWYTTAMYQSSADLVKDICVSGYGINPTTCYNGPSCSGSCVKSSTIRIKGHQMYPNQTHDDPGPNWNWYTYYNLINNTSGSCGTPSGLTASSVTLNSATLNWNTVSGATSYNIQYKPTTSSTWTNTTSSTTSKAISGLTTSTSYEFQVQAVCSSTGTFSSSSIFTTVSSSGSNDDCANAQTITPNATCISTAGSVAGATAGGLPKASCDAFSGTAALKDVWFKFQATASVTSIKVMPSTSLDAVLALYTSCGGSQIGCSDNGGGPGASETINATTLTVGTTYFVRVYSYGATMPSTSTFNICVTSASTSSCGTPTGLSSSSVTSGSAVVSWSAVSGAISYNVQYKPSTSSTWTTVTSGATSMSLSGLSASTAYQFQVQAVCSSSGPFSSAAPFTTAASTSTSSTITLGTAASPYSAHPFGSAYMDSRIEYIITKAELTASGWSASTSFLKSIAFNVSNAAIAQPLGSFTITIAHTSLAAFVSTSFLAGTNAVTVYSGTYSTTTGWNTFNFNNAFAYNGTSNLLITICWNNSSFSSNSSVMAYSYADYKALYCRSDVTNGGVCAQATGTLSYYRPNAKLAFSSTSQLQPFENIGGERSLEVPAPSSIANETTFEVFPNPFDGSMLNGKFSVAMDKKMTLQIYDMLGRVVFAKEVAVESGNFSLNFDEEHFKSGVYTLIGIVENKSFTKRVVVKQNK